MQKEIQFHSRFLLAEDVQALLLHPGTQPTSLLPDTDPINAIVHLDPAKMTQHVFRREDLEVSIHQASTKGVQEYN